MNASLYIHIPFCRKKCDYCDFFSRTPQSFFINEYIDAVLIQIEFMAKHFGVENFESVYIGGGTPSILSAEQIERLCSGIKNASPLVQNAEFTIEANPCDITQEFLQAAQTAGVNRLSIGIQTANDNILNAIGRRTTRAQIKSAASLIEKYWHGVWCADFIAGLPFQTKEVLQNDIDFAATHGVSHISLYSLTVEENTPLAANIAQGRTPYDSDSADELWLFGRDYLEKNNFLQYEISNFAKKGFESRHNSIYWAQKSYLGAGAGAVGTVYGFANGALAGGLRFTNTRDIKRYIDFWRRGVPSPQGVHVAATLENMLLDQLEHLDAATQEFEFLMLGFRTLRGVSAAEYKRRFSGCPMHGDLAGRLDAKGGAFKKWQKKNLAQCTQSNGDTFYSLTHEGILFLNRFLEEI